MFSTGNNKLLYLHMFFLFLISGSLYVQFPMPYLICNAYLLVFAISFLIKKLMRTKVSPFNISCTQLYFCSALIIFGINSVFIFFSAKNIIEIISFVIGMLFLCGLVDSFSFAQLKKAYIDWMTAFSVMSLVLFVVGIAFNRSVYKLPLINSRFIQTSWMLGPFFFQQINDSIGLNFWRVQLFFWEPAVLSLYFFIGILILASEKGGGFKKIFLFVAGIIVTYSTTGIVCSLIVILFKLIRDKYYKANLFLTVAMLVGLGLMGYVALLNVRDKTNVSNVETNEKLMLESSVVKRTLDFKLATNSIQEHPFWGIGFKETPYSSYGYNALVDRGLSNGVLTVLCQFGILGIVWFMPLLRSFRWNNLWWYISSGLFVVIYMGEPLTYSPMYFLLVTLMGMIVKNDGILKCMPLPYDVHTVHERI